MSQTQRVGGGSRSKGKTLPADTASAKVLRQNRAVRTLAPLPCGPPYRPSAVLPSYGPARPNGPFFAEGGEAQGKEVLGITGPTTLC